MSALATRASAATTKVNIQPLQVAACHRPGEVDPGVVSLGATWKRSNLHLVCTVQRRAFLRA
jgi:hypothetical protein